MKAQSFERVLRDAVPPAASADARLSARRAALAEFKSVHSTVGKKTAESARSERAGFWRTNNIWLGGLATASVLVIALSLAWFMPPQSRRLSERAPAITPMIISQKPNGTSSPRANTEAGPPPAAQAEPSAEDPKKSVVAHSESHGVQARVPVPAERPRPGARLSSVQPTPGSEVPSVPPAVPLPAQPLEEVLVASAGRPVQGAVANVPINTVDGARVAKDESAKDAEYVVVTAAKKPSILSRMFRRSEQSESEATGASPVAILSHDDLSQAAGTAEKGRDRFEHFDVNTVKQVSAEPVSTFSADVDTSSYSFVRKQLDQGVLPQKDAVRAEEMINYFDYAWPAAESREQPFRPTIVVSDSPWGKGRKLVHIGIKGYEQPARERPDANLVLLLDVSGSMNEPDKLPFVKQSMKLLLGSLKSTDTVAIVVYAGAAGQVLPPTPVGEKQKIISALDELQAGGSTAGAEGIELAYQLAESSFRKEGVNRILLCTDGDFNVGIDSTHELKGFVERKREKGVFLSVLGFGQGNYRDELAQALAQNGNGVAVYIDTLNEAQKVLVQEAGSSLFTIAKDVKLQVEFNPATVTEYRLVGYETRALKREDFNNDSIDAGDVGAGHAVTAIYEITPVGVDARMVDERRYAKQDAKPSNVGAANEYGFLKIRYKLPNEHQSKLIEQPISIAARPLAESIARDVQFSTAVAGFAQLLRGGQFTGSLSYEDVIKRGLASRGDDAYGYRNEFVQLVRKAKVARGM